MSTPSSSAEAKLILRAIDEISAPARAAMASLNKLSAEFKQLNGVQITRPQQEFHRAATAITHDVDRMQRQSHQMRSGFERMRISTPSFDTGGMIGRIAAVTGAYVSIREGIDSTIGAAREQQAALNEIGIKGGLGEEQIEQLRQRIIALAPATNQTTQDLLAGVDAMVGMGLTAKQAGDAIKPIATAATATGASMDDLSVAAVSAFQNLKVSAADLPRMLDAMASAGNAGAFELRDMARYIPTLGAAYQGLGQTGVGAATDLAAALQIVRKGTGDSASAATNLSNVIQKINAPATRKAFKKLHVNLGSEMEKAAKRGLTPLEAIAEITNKTLKGDLSKLGDLFEDSQVQQGLRPLIQNMEEYRRIRDEAARATGTIARSYDRRMQNADEALKRFSIRLSNMGASIGVQLLDPLGEAANHVADLFESLDQRATIFDTMGAGARGFLDGLGFDGADLGAQLGALENAFLGPVEGAEAAADRIGRAFQRFREIGEDVRAFVDSCGEVAAAVERFAGLDEGAIGNLAGDMASTAAKLGLAALAITAMAGAVRGLAGAMITLSGARAGMAVLRGLAGLTGLSSAAKAITAAMPKTAAVPATPSAPKAGGVHDTRAGGRTAPSAVRDVMGGAARNTTTLSTLMYGAFGVAAEMWDLDTAEKWQERMRENAERDVQANAWLESYIGNGESWRKGIGDFFGAGEAKPQPQLAPVPDQIADRIDTTNRDDDRRRYNATSGIDTLAEAEARWTPKPSPAPADQKVTVSPKIDTTSIDDATQKTETFRSLLDELSAATVRISIPTPRPGATTPAEPITVPPPDVAAPVVTLRLDMSQLDDAMARTDRFRQQLDDLSAMTLRPSVLAPTIPKPVAPEVPGIAAPTIGQPIVPMPRAPGAVPTIAAPEVGRPTVPAPRTPDAVPSIAAPTVDRPVIPSPGAPVIPAIDLSPLREAQTTAEQFQGALADLSAMTVRPRVEMPAFAALVMPDVPALNAPDIAQPVIRPPAPVDVPRIDAPSLSLKVDLAPLEDAAVRAERFKGVLADLSAMTVRPRVEMPALQAPTVPAPVVPGLPTIAAPEVGQPVVPAPRASGEVPSLAAPSVEIPVVPPARGPGAVPSVQAPPAPTIQPILDLAKASGDLAAFAGKLKDDLAVTARPLVDTAALAAASGEAAATGAQMKQALSILATPTVNTSSLDAALAKANAVRSALASMGAAIASAGAGMKLKASSAAAPGPRFGGPRAKGGPTRAGEHYVIGEKGPEIFSPGRTGFVTPNELYASMTAPPSARGRAAEAGGLPAVGAASPPGVASVERAAPSIVQHNKFDFHIKVDGSGDPQKVAEAVVKQASEKLESALIRSRQVLFGGTQNFEY